MHYCPAGDEKVATLQSMAESEVPAATRAGWDNEHVVPDFVTHYYRRIVEARLYQRFVDAGGRPQRRCPHYFVLGESGWFRGLAADMREVQLCLAALPSDLTSVTYPDSFAAMEVSPEFGLPHVPRPHTAQRLPLRHLPAHPPGDRGGCGANVVGHGAPAYGVPMRSTVSDDGAAGVRMMSYRPAASCSSCDGIGVR